MKRLSAALPAATASGRDALRIAAGLRRILAPEDADAEAVMGLRVVAGVVLAIEEMAEDGGSMSREERKEVDSNSEFVLVMVKKKSRREFCSFGGVPFRSRI